MNAKKTPAAVETTTSAQDRAIVPEQRDGGKLALVIDGAAAA